MTGHLLLALHLLGAVVWVGGMFFALLVLRPSLAVLEPPQRLALHMQVFRRFFLIVWHAMPAVIITGYAWYSPASRLRRAAACRRGNARAGLGDGAGVPGHLLRVLETAPGRDKAALDRIGN